MHMKKNTAARPNDLTKDDIEPTKRKQAIIKLLYIFITACGT
jgi:hypothetical protein